MYMMFLSLFFSWVIFINLMRYHFLSIFCHQLVSINEFADSASEKFTTREVVGVGKLGVRLLIG